MTARDYPFFSDRLALAQYVTFYEVAKNGSLNGVYRGQNFFINEQVDYDNGNGGQAKYSFVPFAFTGVTVSRNGDNESTSLIFPNNAVVRVWTTALLGVGRRWVAQVDTLIVDPDNSAKNNRLSSYTGQVISAGWAGPRLEIQLGSVLDAVGADVPRRRITEGAFGPLPTTASIRMA
jgi:hypothetical protein